MGVGNVNKSDIVDFRFRITPFALSYTRAGRELPRASVGFGFAPRMHYLPMITAQKGTLYPVRVENMVMESNFLFPYSIIPQLRIRISRSNCIFAPNQVQSGVPRRGDEKGIR